MLQPKRTKFRKAHKGRIHGLAKGGTKLNFGSFGLNIVPFGDPWAHSWGGQRREISGADRLTGAHKIHIEIYTYSKSQNARKRLPT